MKKHKANRGTSAKVAVKMGVDARTVRRWKIEGAPIDNDYRLRLWLASRKRQIPGAPVQAGAVVPAGKSTEQSGAANALRRLERAEVSAFDALQSAIDGNDPLAIRAARDNWLRIGDSLRRYDTLVEQSRRDAGELIPAGELKRVFTLLLAGVRIQLNRHGVHVGNDALIAGVLPILANEHDKWLNTKIRDYCWGWITDCPEHIRRGLILYTECLAVARSGALEDKTPEEKAITGIINRGLASIASEPRAEDVRINHEG